MSRPGSKVWGSRLPAGSGNLTLTAGVLGAHDLILASVAARHWRSALEPETRYFIPRPPFGERRF